MSPRSYQGAFAAQNFGESYPGYKQRADAAAASNYSIELERASSHYLSAASNTHTGSSLTAFTLEAMVYKASLPGDGEFFGLWSEESTSTTNKGLIWRFTRVGTDYRVQLYVRENNSGTRTFSVNWTIGNTTTPPATGAWERWSVKWDVSTRDCEHLRDGVSDGIQTEGSTVGFVNPTRDPLNIGRVSAAGGHYWNGRIADVRLWNAAISNANIDANKHVYLVGDETNLTHYWPLNNSLEATTSALDLTAQNGASFVQSMGY